MMHKKSIETEGLKSEIISGLDSLRDVIKSNPTQKESPRINEDDPIDLEELIIGIQPGDIGTFKDKNLTLNMKFKNDKKNDNREYLEIKNTKFYYSKNGNKNSFLLLGTHIKKNGNKYGNIEGIYLGGLDDEGYPDGAGVVYTRQGFKKGIRDHGRFDGESDMDYGDKKFVGRNGEGMRKGSGTITYANGEKYEGNWVNGKRDGEGKHYDSEGNLIFDGVWKNDQMHRGCMYSQKKVLQTDKEYLETVLNNGEYKEYLKNLFEISDDKMRNTFKKQRLNNDNYKLFGERNDEGELINGFGYYGFRDNSYFIGLIKDNRRIEGRIVYDGERKGQMYEGDFFHSGPIYYLDKEEAEELLTNKRNITGRLVDSDGHISKYINVNDGSIEYNRFISMYGDNSIDKNKKDKRGIINYSKFPLYKSDDKGSQIPTSGSNYHLYSYGNSIGRTLDENNEYYEFDNFNYVRGGEPIKIRKNELNDFVNKNGESFTSEERALRIANFLNFCKYYVSQNGSIKYFTYSGGGGIYAYTKGHPKDLQSSKDQILSADALNQAFGSKSGDEIVTLLAKFFNTECVTSDYFKNSGNHYTTM